MKRLVLCAAISLASTDALAGGLYIPGTGPQAQGRAGAFVAKADDPSALFHNPAGVAKSSGTVIHLGVNLVDLSLDYQRDGTYQDVDGNDIPYQPVSDQSKPALGLGGFQAIPLIGVTTDFGRPKSPFRFGFGVLAPQAYPMRSFAPSYRFEDPSQQPPAQRYDVMEQEALTIMPSAAVAIHTEKFDVGLRFSAGIASLKATSYVWGVRNYEERVDRDGVFHVEVTDNYVANIGLGALYRPSSSWELGVAFNSPLYISAKGFGTAQLGSDLGLPGMPETIVPEEEFALCERGGTAERLKACVDLALPATVSAGARWILRDARGRERADLEVDVRFENWGGKTRLPSGEVVPLASDFQVVVDGKSGLTGLPLNQSVIRHGLQNVWSVRVGGSYTMDALTLRGGVAHDTKAAPVSWNRLDLDGAPRTTIAGGLSWTMSRMRIDVGGGVVLEPSRKVGRCEPTVANPGCDGSGADTPVADRTQPDPVQPLQGPLNQVQSPFNAGTYESGYLLLHLGLTTWF